MEMFGFRIVHVNGVDVFDTSRCTPYNSLTPEQMQEYMEADVQLNYMEIQKRKEQREKEADYMIGKMFYKFAKLCGFVG